MVPYNRVVPLMALAAVMALAGCDARRAGTQEGTTWGNGSFHSNGERIYFTATSGRGTAITSTGGPPTGMMMMGGRLACASCHGIDAQGGRHMMHMTVMDAPDIRWRALAGEHHHEGAEDGRHHVQEHGEEAGNLPPYSIADFRHAVEEGKHPDGDTLSDDMPRWRMSDEDLRDLAGYLQSLK